VPLVLSSERAMVLHIISEGAVKDIASDTLQLARSAYSAIEKQLWSAFGKLPGT
jgi:hypothetical protein